MLRRPEPSACPERTRREGSGRFLAILATVAILPTDARAQAHSYSLFHRTPRAEARPLATDRPDRTEHARTIPAGWVQVEANLVSWSIDHEADAATNGTGIAQVNLKVGLLDDVDLQLVTELWSKETLRAPTGALLASASGQGVLLGRLKVNLWGNDGGRTALAVMPYAGFVRQDASPEGKAQRRAAAGLIVPFALDLGRDWSLGAMLEVDLANDEPGHWSTTWVQSLTLGHPLWGSLAGYAELFHASSGGEPREITADGGLTFAVSPNLQIDAGVNVGLTSGADDVSPFLGLAVRF